MKTYFIHLRKDKTSPKGGLTIAFHLYKKEGMDTIVDYTSAVCSMKDNFSRKKGRDISKGRLKNPRRKHAPDTFHVPEGTSHKDVVSKLVRMHGF